MRNSILTCTRVSIFIFTTVVLSSCLKTGLEDLPAFEEAEITDVKFDFRYKDMEDINPLDGEPIVKVINLIVEDKVIDATASKIALTLRVPDVTSSFTENVRNTVTLSNIVGKFNLSTAATIAPLNGAPVLGMPGDFSSPRAYRVTAANGTTKDWTVHVTSLNK